MQIKIEIAGHEAVCRQDGDKALSIPVEGLLANYLDRVDSPPSAEAIPEGVRFGWRRGDTLLLVLEEKPALRTVRWLAEDSPAPFGKNAKYRSARIGFPFIVLIIAFHNGELTGQQQCFYRTQPLRSLEDSLLLPNLLNVARAYNQDAWLCLQHIRGQLGALPYEQKIAHIWRHVLNSGWNASSEYNEGMSYFREMRSLDPRISSLESWEKASLADPYFMLSVDWKPVGKNVGQVMEAMLRNVAPPFAPRSADDLVSLMTPRRKRSRTRWNLFGK